MNIQLIASDMDGTLLNSEKKVTPRTYQTLLTAQKAGVEVVPVTGRNINTVDRFLNQIPFVRYISMCNGAILYDNEKKEIFYSSGISAARAKDIYRVCLKYDCSFDFYADGLCLTTKANNLKAASFIKDPVFRQLVVSTRVIIEDIEEYLNQHNCTCSKLYVTFNDDNVKKALTQELLASFDDINVTSSNITNIEINDKQSTKGNSLKMLCQHLNIPIENTMAFGDSTNDIELLKAAGTAVVVSNGLEEVKQYADIIAPSNDEDGVAQIIEEYVLRK